MLLKNKNILFIGPVFFEYTEMIISEIKKQGGNVYFINENRFGFFENIFRRISITFISKITNKCLLKEIKKAPQKIDIVFLIHGDLLRRNFMEGLKQRYKKAYFIMYQWDSVNNNKNIPFLAAFFDKVLSFEKEDCEKYGYEYLPNFHKSKKVDQNEKIEYDLLFIGKGHTDRINFLGKIKEKLSSVVRIKFVIFIPWYRFFLRKYFKNKQSRLTISDFVYTKISYKEVERLILSSKVVLDIANPYQNGLTQRPFQALALGKKIITTSKNIKYEPFYKKENILIVDRQNPVVPIEFINQEPVYVDMENYNITNWVKTIFR